MRFYTGKLEGKQQLFVGFEKDPSLYNIEEYGMKFADMTEQGNMRMRSMRLKF